MWLLHGADDVVLLHQQKVIFFVCLSSSEIICFLYLVQTVSQTQQRSPSFTFRRSPSRKGRWFSSSALRRGCGWSGPPQSSVSSPLSGVHHPQAATCQQLFSSFSCCRFTGSALIFLFAHEGFFDVDAFTGTVWVPNWSLLSAGTRNPSSANSSSSSGHQPWSSRSRISDRVGVKGHRDESFRLWEHVPHPEPR